MHVLEIKSVKVNSSVGILSRISATYSAFSMIGFPFFGS